VERVIVKVCGVRDAAGLAACVEAGVDWIGLNFVPTSRRRIAIDDARALASTLPEDGPRVAGVFRDQMPGDVMRIARDVGLHAVQLHGSEPPTYCAALGGLEVWKAVDGSAATREQLEEFAAWCDMLLLDGRNAGSGEPWTFADARALLDEHGTVSGIPVLLAGGLDPTNVADALRASGAAGVDVASGVERDGAIDRARVVEFVKVARGVAR
jgi:phosphoribosylanthranilate isomerase